MSDIIRNVPDVEVDGSGDATTINEEEGYNVAITTEGDTLEPVYVKTYGGDSFGNQDVLSDGCGNTESRESGATGFQVTVEGILTLEQLRKARAMGLGDGIRVEITLQPWTDDYIIKEFTWDKPNDLNKWYGPNKPNGEEAFTFQIQTRDPTNQVDR